MLPKFLLYWTSIKIHVVHYFSDNLVGTLGGGQEVRLGAVSVVGDGVVRPVLVAGASFARRGPAVSPLVRAMNNVNLGVDIMKVIYSSV